MDPRLTRLYQDELAYLRELGREFAREHPKIAARLGMEGLEVADPYVERLLEGFAFLTARVQLKLEAEQPQLIAHLLESLYPNFLAPVPSMMVVRFAIDPTDPNLARGYPVPRGSAVLSLLPRGQDTQCEFRTASAVTLWPLQLAGVQYFSQASDLELARWPAARSAKGGLRIRLRVGGGLSFDELGVDRLSFYISAPDEVAFRLHELVLGASIGTLVGVVAKDAQPLRWGDAITVRPLGFDDDEALLPETLRAFSGQRLLQEISVLPQRLLFFELGNLAARLAGIKGDEAELIVLFARGDAALETMVDDGSLAIFCTPAVNLFPKRLDRVALGPGSWEYHVVPDRTRPMDLEVHSIDRVVGHGGGRSDGFDGPLEFKPLFASRYEPPVEGHGYYTVRRELRRLSERQRSQGARVPSYVGEEVFISLVDGRHGAFREGLKQLSVTAWVTNRDLPVLLPTAGQPGERVWQLDAPGPVTGVDCLRGPTRPVSRQPVGDIGWQLVTQVTQNHLELGDEPARAAAALRDLLRLYGPPNDVVWAHQVEGVHGLKTRQSVRRLPFPGPLSFGCGIEIELELDEQSFQGASAFLLGSVLERFYARFAAINSYTQLTLRSQQRGVIKAWPARGGWGQIA